MTSIDTSCVQRLDEIFSSANDYEEATRKMNAEFVVIPRNRLTGNSRSEKRCGFEVGGIMFYEDVPTDRSPIGEVYEIDESEGGAA